MNPVPPAIIDLGDLVLRRWRADDADVLAALVLASLDHLAPWMPWAADGYGMESAAGFLAHCDQGWADGTVFNYAIVADGVISGSCGLMRRIGPGGLEIGYWVSKQGTRRGLATRASAALTDQAFRLPGIDRVEIHHDELNDASAGVPAKLGFTRIGTERSPMPAPQGTGTDVIWRRTRVA